MFNYYLFTLKSLRVILRLPYYYINKGILITVDRQLTQRLFFLLFNYLISFTASLIKILLIKGKKSFGTGHSLVHPLPHAGIRPKISKYRECTSVQLPWILVLGEQAPASRGSCPTRCISRLPCPNSSGNYLHYSHIHF